MSQLYAYIIAGIGALVIGFTLGWQVNGWRWEARSNAAAEAARAAERQAQQSVIDSLKNDIRASQESSNAYQAELNRLRNAPVHIPPVRVCKPTRNPAHDLPAARPPAGRPDATTEAGRVVPGDPPDDTDRDIGPELAALADEGDRCSAQLRALIDWVGKISDGTR